MNLYAARSQCMISLWRQNIEQNGISTQCILSYSIQSFALLVNPYTHWASYPFKAVLLLIRVTRLVKNLPNFWKCGQNCSPNIKNQIENTKHLHPSATECWNKYNKSCFGTAHLCKNKIAHVKVAEWPNFAQSGHTVSRGQLGYKGL